MKKTLIIISLVVLVLSLWANIKTMQEKNRSKELMINHIFSAIITVTRNLESFTASVDKDDIPTAKTQLLLAAIGLIEVDNQIEDGSYYIDNKLYYPGILSFKFIGEGLIYGVEVNGKTIDPVFKDNVVSDSESKYIKRLLKDLNGIIKELKLKEDPNNPNEKLPVQMLNRIFELSFYNTWSHIDNSPYEWVWK